MKHKQRDFIISQKLPQSPNDTSNGSTLWITAWCSLRQIRRLESFKEYVLQNKAMHGSCGCNLWTALWDGFFQFRFLQQQIGLGNFLCSRLCRFFQQAVLLQSTLLLFWKASDTSFPALGHCICTDSFLDGRLVTRPRCYLIIVFFAVQKGFGIVPEIRIFE